MLEFEVLKSEVLKSEVLESEVLRSEVLGSEVGEVLLDKYCELYHVSWPYFG